MILMQLPKKQWAKAWRAMIEVGPIQLIRKDPVYAVTAAHVQLLASLGFTFKVIQLPRRPVKSAKSRGPGK